MRRVTSFILTVFCIGISLPIFGQSSTPKYSNEYLTVGVGARAFGLGRAQVAAANDLTASYWNPAGLTKLESEYQVSFMHSEFFGGIAKYDYLGFGMRIDSLSALGFTAIRMGVDDIPDTRFLYDANGALNYDNVQLFSAADYGFLFSYARMMGFLPGLSLGGNFKVLHRNVGEFATAWGFGIDIGARYNRKDWQFGLMLKDITGTFTAWNHNTQSIDEIYLQTGNTIPESTLEVTLPRLILGVAKRFSIKNNWGVMPVFDLTTTFDGKRNVLIQTDLISIEPQLGLEIDYKSLAYLRLGASGVQRVEDFDGNTSMDFQPAAGIGVRVKSIDVDYALTDMGTDGDTLFSHVFSLLIRLNK